MSTKLTASLCLFLALVLPGHAQQERLTFINPVLNLSAGSETQTIAGRGEVSDTLYLVAPSVFGLKRFGPRTRFSAFYQPEFEMFNHNTEQNAWNHQGRIYIGRKISPRLTFDLGNSFLASRDPSRHLGNGFLMLPRHQYRENSLYLSFDFTRNPATTWSVRYDNTITRYGLPAEYRTGFLDQMGNAITVVRAHNFSGDRKLSVAYSLLHLALLDSEGPSIRQDGSYTHFLTLGYSHALNPGFRFSVASGVIRANDFSYTVAGQVEKRIASIWFDAGYSRSIAFFGGGGFSAAPSADPRFANGLQASNLFQMATVGIRARLHHRVGFDLRAVGARNSSRLLDFNSRSLVGRARLDYRLSDWMVLFSTAEFYAQNLNELPGVPTERRRFFGGLEFSLFPSRSADSRGSTLSGGPAPGAGVGTTEEE
jgi:hypothetical protein